MKEYGGKKKTKKFIIFAILTGICISPISFILDFKLFLIIFLSILLLESYLIWKEKIGREVLIALLLAIIITSYYDYQYTTPNILIGRINLFPLISWTFGLTLLKELHERLNVKHKILVTTIIYWTILLTLEYFFYHILNVRLDSSYPGLFGLDLMHAQTGMKFFYITAGPLYIWIIDYLRLK